MSELVGPQVLRVWKLWWTDLAERAAGQSEAAAPLPVRGQYVAGMLRA